MMFDGVRTNDCLSQRPEADKGVHNENRNDL